jgi:hypothetical protein
MDGGTKTDKEIGRQKCFVQDAIKTKVLNSLKPLKTSHGNCIDVDIVISSGEAQKRNISKIKIYIIPILS